MQPLTKSLVAVTLLAFAGASFAQDEATEESGSWWDSITGFFSGLFSTGEDEPAAESSAAAGEPGGMEWYAGGQGSVTKYEDNAVRVARHGYAGYAGGVFGNRTGFELGYFRPGNADVKGAPGVVVEGDDGYRGMVTFNTEAGDSPVRLGVGYYKFTSSGSSDSAKGFSLGVKFEQAVTENLFLTLGTDLFLGGHNSPDAIVFGLGVAYHSARPLPAAAEEGEEVEVTAPAAPAEEAPAEEAPAVEEPADEPAEEPAQ